MEEGLPAMAGGSCFLAWRYAVEAAGIEPAAWCFAKVVCAKVLKPAPGYPNKAALQAKAAPQPRPRIFLDFTFSRHLHQTVRRVHQSQARATTA